jgi:hypothetical protein
VLFGLHDKYHCVCILFAQSHSPEEQEPYLYLLTDVPNISLTQSAKFNIEFYSAILSHEYRSEKVWIQLPLPVQGAPILLTSEKSVHWVRWKSFSTFENVLKWRNLFIYFPGSLIQFKTWWVAHQRPEEPKNFDLVKAFWEKSHI